MRRDYNRSMLHAVAAALTLALAPYHGPALRGAVPASRSFALAVHGAPRAHVHLRAVAVPNGFIASFCTPRICAPFAVPLTLDASGGAAIELQIVRNDEHAPAPRTVRVRSDDGATVAIAYARGTTPR